MITIILILIILGLVVFALLLIGVDPDHIKLILVGLYFIIVRLLIMLLFIICVIKFLP